MDEAVRSRMVAKTPEQFAEEVHRCYPFHPRLRDLVALFRNNESFRQTRGLMRMVSRIVKDVYSDGRPNNVGLIGVQHMDLNDSDMRNEVLPLADLQEAVATDIADGGQSHAETIDRELGTDAGSQVANVIMCASLMRGLDAKAGLTKEQVVECLIAPSRQGDEFATAFDALVKDAWYLHRGW
jgi:predicted AAA+ superfamily ATPase